MNIKSIIREADILVPNEATVVEKIIFLDGMNRDFFNVVKIPKTMEFLSIKNQSTYTLAADVRQKNIEFIMCGVIKYRELTDETPNPMHNTFSFDDVTNVVTLRPSPYANGLNAIMRYNRIATTTFMTGELLEVPDCPVEYHYSFVFGLASYIAQTQDEGIKASNYENQYKAMWNVAAQNYAKEVTQ